jgi:arginine N-succinyltransferase
MLVLRPCTLADLPAVERIAARSAVGVTSLPPDRQKLQDKIVGSAHAFATDVEVNGEESYFFVLENAASGEIVGTSGIVASAGFHDRFYSYRNEIIVHASQELKVSNKIHSLHLCHDLTGCSLLTSFYIDPAWADSEWPQLLSRARLLFIGEFPQRFADRLAAENPGVCDAEGRSPFWDAVGKRFFNMEYPQAERLSGGHSKTFIAELMPQYPIYVPLLPADARLAIGRLNPLSELPFSILLDEGFEADTYVDIFDAGPTVAGRVQSLRTVQASRRLKVGLAASPAATTQPWIIASTGAEKFRATLANAIVQAGEMGDEILLDRGIAEVLGVGPGDTVRAAPLGGAHSASRQARSRAPTGLRA